MFRKLEIQRAFAGRAEDSPHLYSSVQKQFLLVLICCRQLGAMRANPSIWGETKKAGSFAATK